MRKTVFCLSLLILPLVLGAADTAPVAEAVAATAAPAEPVAAPVAAAAANAPSWLQWVWPALGAILIPFIVSFLKKKSAVAAAEAEAAKFDASKSLLEQKNFLIDKRLIPYLWASAEHVAAVELPIILADATDGDGKFDWKGHANRMKDRLLADAKSKFQAEGIDIVKEIGEKYLGELIDRAILKTIPWLPQGVQGMVGKVAEGQGSDLAKIIVEKGLTAAQNAWLNKTK